MATTVVQYLCQSGWSEYIYYIDLAVRYDAVLRWYQTVRCVCPVPNQLSELLWEDDDGCKGGGAPRAVWLSAWEYTHHSCGFVWTGKQGEEGVLVVQLHIPLGTATGTQEQRPGAAGTPQAGATGWSTLSAPDGWQQWRGARDRCKRMQQQSLSMRSLLGRQ